LNGAAVLVPAVRACLLRTVQRETETQAWNKSGFNKLKDGERLLLWHGSRSTNFAGILSQGLRIAPPEGTGQILRFKVSVAHHDGDFLQRRALGTWPGSALCFASGFL
jgi:hypothetical protein